MIWTPDWSDLSETKTCDQIRGYLFSAQNYANKIRNAINTVEHRKVKCIKDTEAKVVKSAINFDEVHIQNKYAEQINVIVYKP